MAQPKPSPAPGEPANPTAGEPPPVIDSISVEKPSVCNGEENLVTVKAHTVNRTDEDLHYAIDGQLGQSVPVTLWRSARSDTGPGKHVISVFGRGNVTTTVPIPEYEVRDCALPRVALVTKRVRSNTWAEYDFQVSIAAPRTWNRSKAGPWKPFEPASYFWSFGDGESVATTVPTAQHSYEGRAQDTGYSYFLVSVEVHGKDGDVVQGRTSLALVNPAFEALRDKGIVALLVSLDPRFPELGPDGRVAQGVRIWHTRSGPVTIESAWRTRYYARGGRESRPELVDVQKVLGATVIPPGKDGIRTSVVLDPSEEPDVFSVTYRLAGTSEERLPVSGSFTVMKPPPVPTRETSVPVVDPLLKAKILRARQILAKDTVDDEDIMRLERDGKFAGLAVPPADSSAPAVNVAPPPGRGPPRH
jgi:hypothetical protein